jgi:glutaredoxin-related protein
VQILHWKGENLSMSPQILPHSFYIGGFSAKVVQALQAEGFDFGSVNVLDYPDIREGVKKFA